MIDALDVLRAANQLDDPGEHSTPGCYVVYGYVSWTDSVTGDRTIVQNAACNACGRAWHRRVKYDPYDDDGAALLAATAWHPGEAAS